MAYPVAYRTETARRANAASSTQGTRTPYMGTRRVLAPPQRRSRSSPVRRSAVGRPAPFRPSPLNNARTAVQLRLGSVSSGGAATSSLPKTYPPTVQNGIASVLRSGTAFAFRVMRLDPRIRGAQLLLELLQSNRLVRAEEPDIAPGWNFGSYASQSCSVVPQPGNTDAQWRYTNPPGIACGYLNTGIVGNTVPQPADWYASLWHRRPISGSRWNKVMMMVRPAGSVPTPITWRPAQAGAPALYMPRLPGTAFPQVDPLATPVHAPQPTPYAVPYRSRGLWKSNPYRVEQTQKGPAAPPRMRQRPTIRESVEYRPGEAPRPGAKHEYKRPNRRTREMKAVLSATGRGAFFDIISGLGEFNDWVKAIYDAVPDHLRTQARTPQERLRVIFRHFSKIKARDVVGNIVEMHLTDLAWGKWGQALGGAARRLNLSVGLQTGYLDTALGYVPPDLRAAIEEARETRNGD